MNNENIYLERYRTYTKYGDPIAQILIRKNGLVTNLEKIENIGKIYDYKLNSDGLRCVEFSEKPEILALGCSLTFGTGLPEEHVWPNLLKSMLNKSGYDYKVGIIAYNAGSIMKSISSMFSMLHKYQYTPKYIFCNFPEITRYQFLGPEESDWNIQDYSLGKNDGGPAKWDWVFYANFEYLKMLEVFCAQSGIRLIWSSWEQDATFDSYCLKHFDNYKIENKKDLFMTYPLGDIEKYKMKGWDEIRCHEDFLKEFGEYAFNCAYDNAEAKPPIVRPGAPSFMPHYGIHRQQHWAEFFYEEAGFRPYTNPIQNDIIDK